MRITELLEARSHPELNPKIPTWDQLEAYRGGGYYVHFNKIEKVGVNLQSQNTYGPWGVYSFPLDYVLNADLESYIFSQKGWFKVQFAHVLKPRSGLRVLDLKQLDSQIIDQLRSSIKSMISARQQQDPDIKDYLDDPNDDVKKQWESLKWAVARISDSQAPRNQNRPLNILTQSLWNKLLRRAGYDALRDDQRLLNENPNQMVFLHGAAFDIVKTIPMRPTESLRAWRAKYAK